MTGDVRDALSAARSLVVAGWCQGKAMKLTMEGPRYCAIGALSAATRCGYDRDLMDDCKAVLEASMPTRFTLVQFNDAPGRTQAEVVALFDRALEAM